MRCGPLCNEQLSNRTKLRNISAVALLLLGATVIIVVGICLIETQDKVGCQIFPFEVDPSPIVVISGTNKFIYPHDGEQLLRSVPDQSLDFICPGRKVILAQSETSSSLISGTCVGGSKFKIADEEVDWKDLRCSNYPIGTIRYTGSSCENDGREIEVGFEVEYNRFLRSLLICFNQKLQVAYYTYIELPASINQRIRFTPRPRFQQGSGFYDIGTVNNLYLRKKQRVTINRLLGLPDNSDKYIQDKTNFFLSRGHLTANHDNFYAAQQNATFFYQNVAPQWQTFNGFNWNQIEIDVRDYADINAVDLQVWTGVHGIVKLPHEKTGQLTELYLYVDQTSNRKALPVPEIYWKVVYNPATERGIALIGINNPYSSTFPTICNDVSQRLTWLHWNRDNQQKGFGYACSIETFRKAVTFEHNISDGGLLL